MIKLFAELLNGMWFHFYTEKDKKLMKLDSDHYLSTTHGVRKISPTMAVEPETKRIPATKSIFGAEPKDETNE